MYVSFLLTKKKIKPTSLVCFINWYELSGFFVFFFSFVPGWFQILYGFLFVKCHHVIHRLHSVKSDDVCTIWSQNVIKCAFQVGRVFYYLWTLHNLYFYRMYWPSSLQSCTIMLGVYNNQYSVSSSISSQMCYSINVGSVQCIM